MRKYTTLSTPTCSHSYMKICATFATVRQCRYHVRTMPARLKRLDLDKWKKQSVNRLLLHVTLYPLPLSRRFYKTEGCGYSLKIEGEVTGAVVEAPLNRKCLKGKV